MRQAVELRILKMVANFYHELFYKNEPLFPHQYKQLAHWHISRPEIKKFNLGFCPNKEDIHYSGKAFAKYYEEMWLKYPQLTKICINMGLLNPIEKGYEDGLAGAFTFPYYDEKGELFNLAIFYPERWWQLLNKNDTLAIFGLKQACYDLQDYKMAILVEDVYDFFSIHYLLSPTGINPCLLCHKKISLGSLEKLRQFKVEQAFVVGLKEFPDKGAIDLIFIPKTRDALEALNQILSLIQNKRLKRLIEVGLELIEKRGTKL
ncbi:MAG: hypothetical protein AMJ45_00065 [Syntrophobacter sp. DG_60]|nr:MAG: hypothetical protein AMJ45_00065 [Syntrophobacter sp. DG_60]